MSKLRYYPSLSISGAPTYIQVPYGPNVDTKELTYSLFNLDGSVLTMTLYWFLSFSCSPLVQI